MKGLRKPKPSGKIVCDKVAKRKGSAILEAALQISGGHQEIVIQGMKAAIQSRAFSNLSKGAYISVQTAAEANRAAVDKGIVDNVKQNLEAFRCTGGRFAQSAERFALKLVSTEDGDAGPSQRQLSLRLGSHRSVISRATLAATAGRVEDKDGAARWIYQPRRINTNRIRGTDILRQLWSLSESTRLTVGTRNVDTQYIFNPVLQKLEKFKFNKRVG